MKTSKRLLSLLLALLMVLSLSPAPFALAEEPEGTIAPVSEPSPEPAAPEDPVGDGVLDVPSDEPAAAPTPDAPQDDEHYFITQPQSGSFDPDTLKYHCTWATSFKPLRVEIRYKNWNTWEDYDSVTSPPASAYYDFPAAYGSQEYYIKAYYGSGTNDYVSSDYFTVTDESLTFVVPPQGGSYDPATLKYHCTWTTSFTPKRVEIRYKNWNTWEDYDSVTSPPASAYYDFPAAYGSQEYYIKAYYGSGTNDYVSSDYFTVTDESLEFLVQPRDGSYDPATLKYHCTWTTSFKPLRVEIRYKNWNTWEDYDSVTSPPASAYYDFPAAYGSQEYYIEAYYGSGTNDYVSSDYFTVTDESLEFLVQPQDGSYDPATLKYHCTWTTSFTPKRVVIRYKNWNTWEDYDSVTSPPASAYYDFPAAYGSQEYYIEAYYGSGTNDYVSSDYFTVTDESLEFLVQPRDGSFDPDSQSYLAAWQTNFTPLRVEILYKSVYFEPYDEITSPQANGSYEFPATSGTNEYRIIAYYGTGTNDYVSSSSFVVSDQPVVTSGDCGFMDASSVHWSYENHTLTLSGNGFTGDFPSMAIVPWDHLRSQITTVVVEEGIQDVGAYTFQDCLNLETVYLPSTVVKIGDYAFINCPKLTDVYWNVGEQGMWDVTWTPSRNTSLAEANKHFAFIAEGQAGPNLTWRLANDGVLSFSGSGAMYNWTSSEPAPWYSYRGSITQLRLVNVTTVGDYAFRGCTKLSSVSFPSDLTYLGVRAFGSCTGLTTVYWAAPNFMNLTEIPEACFSGCTALQSFTVPKKCTLIGQGAFSGCDALTTVSFPEGSALTQVGNRAFYSCDALKNIPLPNGVTGLGDEAFYNCKSLTSFPLPSTLTSLGAYCFSGCSGVTGVVTIPAGLTQIPERCFLGCSGFYKLALTPKVTEIGPYAFSGCSKLMNVEYDGFRAQWENVSVGGGNTPLTSASFSWLFRSGKIAGTEVYWRIYGGPGKLEIYGSGNMKDWETTPEIAPWYSYRLYIETIDIHPSVESVGINAFRMCKNLKTVYLPDTLKKIGSGAFNDSSDLADVWYNGSELMREYKLTIDGYNNPLLRAQWHYADIGGVVTGPNGAGAVDLFWSFDPDSGTLRVYWSDEIMDQNHLEIPDYVDGQDTPWYQYNHGQLVPLIKAVQVDELVTRIGDYAFAGLNELTDVQIASTVTGIGEGAFMGCRNLIVITIPDTVETLGDNLFWNCGSLEAATLPAGLTAIPSGTFFNCEELTRVFLPGTLERIEKNAFDRCTGLTDIYFNGTSAQWQAIELYSGNDPVNSAKIHFTPPEIAVDAVNFPDLAFRAYVTENIDTDRSGWLTDEECLAVTSIVCPNQQVASLQGIQFFPELSYLNAGGNMLTGDLDLTANSRLSFLDVSRNQLNNVILTDLTSLTTLLLAGNDTGMNAPDLSTNIALEYLDCRGCDGMEGLDLSANTALITLDCSWNQIETLDLSANTALQTLDCSHNNLTSLDLSANTELRQLSCNNNVLTTLTLGNQDKLFTLACYGNSLSRLDLTGCPRLLAAVQEGTVTKTESYLEYRRGADYVQADKSTLLITAHYSLLGLRASAAGVVQDSAGKYMLSSVQRTPVWQGGNAPGFTALINSTSVICSDEATLRPITAEPVPGGVYFLYMSLSTNTQSQGAVDFSHLSAADCSLILPGFSCECICVTIGVSSAGYDKATILFRITKDAPEGIPIDEEHFPDAAFRAYVAENFDSDANGYLTDAECEAVKTIDVGAMEIASLKGIEYFGKITQLGAESNQLTELDLSGNPCLENICVSYNSLTSLDLSRQELLTYLEVDGNDLAALDLSVNTELESLYCSENEIASLDVSMLPKLINLGCGDNALTELDLHANKDLRFLNCSSNMLTEIDLSANTALQTLYVIGNPMPSLDVSLLPELRVLECYDMPLEALTLGKLSKLSRFACYWMSADLLLDFTGCPILMDAYKNGSRRIITITEELSFAEYKNATQGGVLELDVNPLVLGDLNGDGTISALDLLQMRKALVGIPESDLIAAAADLYQNGTIDILDLVRLRKILAD